MSSPANGAASGSHGSSTGVQSLANETITTTITQPTVPTDAAEQTERDRLDQELGGDVAPRRAQRAAQADLADPLEHRHEGHVGDAERADSSDTAPSTRNRPLRVLCTFA